MGDEYFNQRGELTDMAQSIFRGLPAVVRRAVVNDELRRHASGLPINEGNYFARAVLEGRLLDVEFYVGEATLRAQVGSGSAVEVFEKTQAYRALADYLLENK